MSKYCIQSTDKLKEQTAIMVPINRLHVAYYLLDPGGELEFETDHDPKDAHGNLTALEKKGMLKFLEEDSSKEEEELEEKEELEEEPEEAFACEQCDREFSSERGLNAHMRVHNDEEEDE